MIASVSTFSRSSGATTPVCTMNFSMIRDPEPLPQLANVDEMTFDRRGGCHRRAHEVRASARALAAFEVAVRGGRAALARLESVRVHREAHREARFGEDLVEAFALGLRLHETRARHDHREADVRRHAAAQLLHDVSGGAQIFD